MNTTSALTADASLASEISKLLLLRAVVGDGIDTPIPWAPYTVFTQSFPDELYLTLVRAALALQSEAAGDYTWPLLNDPELSKETFSRELNQTQRHSLCYLDHYGGKFCLAAAHHKAITKYLTWPSMSLTNLWTAIDPKFLHFSGLPDHQSSVNTLRKYSHSCDCILIPGGTVNEELFDLSTQQVKQLLQRFFEKGGASHTRVPVRLETEALGESWFAFLESQEVAFCSGKLTPKQLQDKTASVKFVVAAASHAAQIFACVEQCEEPSISLTAGHLHKAKAYAALLFAASYGIEPNSNRIKPVKRRIVIKRNKLATTNA